MFRAPALVTVLSLGATLVMAASPALASGHDAVAACPRMAEHLQDELQPVVARLDKPGRLQVRFEAQGPRAGRVWVDGAPRGYHGPVRRALRSMRCEGLVAGQMYVLNIEFRDI